MEITPYWTSHNKELVLKVADNNPGALEVTKHLQWFSNWEKILRWLSHHGYIGSKLWMLYKDEHKYDWMALGKWAENKMRNQTIIEKRDYSGGDFEV